MIEFDGDDGASADICHPPAARLDGEFVADLKLFRYHR